MNGPPPARGRGELGKLASLKERPNSGLICYDPQSLHGNLKRGEGWSLVSVGNDESKTSCLLRLAWKWRKMEKIGKVNKI